MATSTVKNAMIEFKSFDDDSLRIRLDNPKDAITREQVSSAFQKAFLERWIICSKGSIADYIGEIVIETSTKVSLEGEDYYVTPNALTININGTQTQGRGNITVSGAQVQGYNITNLTNGGNFTSVVVTIKDNGLSVQVEVNVSSRSDLTSTFDLILIIRGNEVTIPCTVHQTH